MTYEQLFAEARRLPVLERLRLLEAIARSLRDEGDAMPLRGVPASELEGRLKTEDPPPTDEELREDYVNYLIEKYR